MRVLMLGVYDLEGYSRGRILWKGLQKNEVDVDLIRPRGGFKYLSIARRLLKRDFDAVIATGKFVLLTAWLLKWWHRKPIVFDVFISDYDALVLDRKLVREGSLKARLFWWADRIAPKLAAHSILDTAENIGYFVKEFGLDRERFSVIPVGADDTVFKCLPMPKSQETRVYFQGTYIPVQGVDVIVRAAKLLEKEKSITFTLLGTGQTYEACRRLADELGVKINWLPFMPLTELAKNLSAHHISLGIFSGHERGIRAVPNKAYETIASCRALITEDGPAPRSVFTHGKDVLLIEPGNPQALAEAIRRLSKDKRLRDRIAKNGYALFRSRFSVARIGKQMRDLLESISRPS